MTLISSFLLIVEIYCEAAGVSESTLSSRMFNDGKRISQLRGGADIGAKRLEASLKWMSASWPANAIWPHSFPRPSQQSNSEAAE
ncbi:hypothetical protein [Neorhizobium alkalisoli]|uniref:hypothetical protein n=1 Tax=Neorhizobium alkalisoli TaxID=528178 RepID=UPI0011A8E15B|nr:hypothetical protein [Neorhizobium alkalisoli]